MCDWAMSGPLSGRSGDDTVGLMRQEGSPYLVPAQTTAQAAKLLDVPAKLPDSNFASETLPDARNQAFLSQEGIQNFLLGVIQAPLLLVLSFPTHQPHGLLPTTTHWLTTFDILSTISSRARLSAAFHHLEHVLRMEEHSKGVPIGRTEHRKVGQASEPRSSVKPAIAPRPVDDPLEGLWISQSQELTPHVVAHTQEPIRQDIEVMILAFEADHTQQVTAKNTSPRTWNLSPRTRADHTQQFTAKNTSPRTWGTSMTDESDHAS
ncbi:hypothetical protein BKA70DRAFT_1237084 [Coprinopsis sp. MPI-PUGE-AT-0042]|nr:hypothetical protein BKA70DRAFT_1237084 [Coprinopsis sp. MPI-PUGE-AT-0042]